MKQFRFFSYIRIGEYMKIEVIDKNSVFIFINSEYLKNSDLSSKEEIVKIVKDLVIRFKNRLSLHGFYKVKVFVNKRVGLFLDIDKLEDIEFANTVDLRVIAYLDDKVFFESEDFDILPKESMIYYFNNKFYCNVDDIPNIIKIADFGRFLYGKEVIQVMDKGIIV